MIYLSTTKSTMKVVRRNQKAPITGRICVTFLVDKAHQQPYAWISIKLTIHLEANTFLKHLI